MDNYTLFESYLSNKLSEKDRLNFEASRKNDAALEEAFQEHIVTQVSLDILQEEDIESVISGLKRDESAVREGNKFKWRIMAAAAVIALALFFWAFLNQGPKTTETEQLIAEYYKAPLKNATRSGDDPIDNPAVFSMTKAHVLFRNKEYDLAAEQFDEIVKVADGVEKERAEWFLALSILDSDPKRAKKILMKISEISTHKKQQEALKLLSDPRF